MRDRVAVNPGRVLIAPESGSPYYATLTRADNPTQEGTPLNKNSLLKDATAALLGGDMDMVPDEAFVALKGLIDGLTPADVGAATVVSGRYKGTGKHGSSNKCSLTFGFEPKVAAMIMETDRPYVLYWVKGVIYMRTMNLYTTGAANTGEVTFSVSGNTLSWYSDDVYAQLNVSGKTTNYVAIG